MSVSARASVHYDDMTGTAAADWWAGPVQWSRLDDLRRWAEVPAGYRLVGLRVGWHAPHDHQRRETEPKVYLELLGIDAGVLPEGCSLDDYAGFEEHEPVLFAFRGEMPVPTFLDLFKELSVVLLRRSWDERTAPRIVSADH